MADVRLFSAHLSVERGGAKWRYPRFDAWRSTSAIHVRIGWLRTAIGLHLSHDALLAAARTDDERDEAQRLTATDLIDKLNEGRPADLAAAATEEDDRV